MLDSDSNVIPLHSNRPDCSEAVRVPESAAIAEMRRMLREDYLDEKEARALHDEREFRRRFGRTWPRAYRAWLLDFQLEHRLEDVEVRWLNWSRSLKVGRTGLYLDDSRFVAVYGWACIVALWLVYGTSLLRLAHVNDYSARSVLLSAAVMLLMLAMSRGLWLFYVLPRKISTALACGEIRRGPRG